jgi:hypothetical protein
MSKTCTKEANMGEARHQLWATISGSTASDLESQVNAVIASGIEAVEYRLDLIPRGLWSFVLECPKPSVPWWVAHFGTGIHSRIAHEAISASLSSDATGVIFHSRCEGVDGLVQSCRSQGRQFAAPFHSQLPLTVDAAIDEFRYQESFRPTFRQIAVRAESFDDANALVQATRYASKDGGSPAVGAVFGPQRWARVALPHAGSAITFIVAHRVKNEIDGDDEQLQLSELHDLCKIRNLIANGLRELVTNQQYSDSTV